MISQVEAENASLAAQLEMVEEEKQELHLQLAALKQQMNSDASASQRAVEDVQSNCKRSGAIAGRQVRALRHGMAL